MPLSDSDAPGIVKGTTDESDMGMQIRRSCTALLNALVVACTSCHRLKFLVFVGVARLKYHITQLKKRALLTLNDTRPIPPRAPCALPCSSLFHFPYDLSEPLDKLKTLADGSVLTV